MKKITVILLALIMSISFVACSSKSDDTAVDETTETTTQLVEKTTALPTDDEEKSNLLNARVSEILSMEGAHFGTVATGGFSYELVDALPEDVYQNEASDKIKAQAEEKAKAFVDGIREFYNDEITFVSSETRVVGTGDNGVDSALYEITYKNSQDQTLVIIADSRGEIVIVKCKFTW